MSDKNKQLEKKDGGKLCPNEEMNKWTYDTVFLLSLSPLY